MYTQLFPAIQLPYPGDCSSSTQLLVVAFELTLSPLQVATVCVATNPHELHTGTPFHMLSTRCASHGTPWSGILWEWCGIQSKMPRDDTTFHEFVMHYRCSLTVDYFVVTHLIVWTVQGSIIYLSTAIEVIDSAHKDNITITHAKKSGIWYI